MRRVLPRISAVCVVAMLVSGCGAGQIGLTGTDGDSGANVAENDAGTHDAGDELDAGDPGVDAGDPRNDAGDPRNDAGDPRIDAGAPRTDAGTTTDGGQPKTDAGAYDSGFPSNNFPEQFITITVPAEASDDVYFAPGGTDTGDCPKSAPCATPLYAMQRVNKGSNGHNVWCATGTYTLPAEVGGSVSSGTAATRTFFGPYPNQHCTFTFPDGGMSLQGLNYWTFHNARYNSVNFGFVFFGTLYASGHVQFYRNHFHQSGTHNYGGYCGANNCGQISLNSSALDYVDIVQNEFENLGFSSESADDAAIITFQGPNHTTIIGNLIHDIPHGIFSKFGLRKPITKSGTAWVIANNIVYNTYIGPISNNVDWALIQNNVFADLTGANNTGQSTLCFDNGLTTGGANAIWSRNTAHNVAFSVDSLNPICANVTHQYNLYTGAWSHGYQISINQFRAGTGLNGFATNHNRYYAGLGFLPNNSNVLTLTEWRAGPYNQDVNSAVGAVTYMGAPETAPQTPSTWAATPTPTDGDGHPVGVVWSALLTTGNPFAQ